MLPGSPRSWGRSLATLWALATFAVPITTVLAIRRAYTPIPYGDQWEEVFLYERLTTGAASWFEVLRPHGMHIIAVPRLFFLIDLRWFNGTSALLVSVNAAFQALTLVLLLRESARCSNVPGAARRFLYGVHIALLCAAVQLTNFIWGFQVSFVLVFTAAVAAIISLENALDPQASHRRSWLAATVLSATVSTFCMANGILVWPILFLQAWLARGSRSLLLVLSSVGGLAFVYWTRNTGGEMEWGYPSRVFLRTFAFFTLYLGAPLRHAGEAVAAVAGFFGLCSAGILLSPYLRRRTLITRFVRVHGFIICFCLGSAAATAFGRVRLEPSAALVSRYATGGLLFWTSMVTLGLYAVLRVRRSVWPHYAVGVAVMLIWVLQPGQWFALREEQSYRSRKEQAALALAVGVPDAMLGWLHPDPTRVFSAIPFLRRARISPFHTDWAACPGRALDDLFSSTPIIADGVGAFDAVAPVYLSTAQEDWGQGLRAYGWARRRWQGADLRYLLLVDGTGIVQGVGMPNLVNEPIDETERALSPRPDRWFGFARPTATGALSAFAVFANGEIYRLTGTHNHVAPASAPNQRSRAATSLRIPAS